MSETEFYIRSVTELDGLALDFAVAKVLNTLNEEGRPRIRYTKNPGVTFSLLHAHLHYLAQSVDSKIWYACSDGLNVSHVGGGATPTLAVLRAVCISFGSTMIYLKPLMRATGKTLEEVLAAP